MAQLFNHVKAVIKSRGAAVYTRDSCRLNLYKNWSLFYQGDTVKISSEDVMEADGEDAANAEECIE